MPVMQAKMRAVCILTLLDQFDPLTVLTYPVYVLDLKIIHLMLSSFWWIVSLWDTRNQLMSLLNSSNQCYLFYFM